MYKTLVKLENLILEFSKEFAKRKQEKNIVDFSDIEHFALNILLKEDDKGNLIQSDVAKMYSQKFEEIAIDEYQDSNLVQEYIMTAISRNNNIFMVGDVKQSIYKFRQAMPELFLSKYNNYKTIQDEKDRIEDNNNLKIQLFKNFRSRKNILDFTNLIFENIMSTKLGDVEYNKEEFLNLGAKDYKENEQNLKTEIDIINLKEEERLEDNENSNDEVQEERYEDIELEAKFVAKRIKELIDQKFQVYDRKKEQFRTIEYRDIAILLRSTKNKANIFEQELINLGMSVFSDTSQEYLDSIEIQTIICLLKIIDNPMQDIPLVTVLRSNICKFSDEDLIKIRLSDRNDSFYNCLLKAKINVDDDLKQKIENFLENLRCWREEQEYLALDEFIWKIYSDTGYYNYVGLMPNGNLRQANLKLLFEKAKQFETASFKGLYNFINFIDKIKLGSGDLSSAKLIGENDNVIRIMSIHKSKGLEFPVVFLANTSKQFNMQSLRTDPILLHTDLGIGMKYINHNLQVEYDTNAKIAVKNKLEIENISEEMRVLYVALTRAKEKLIITGISKDYQKQLEKTINQVKIYSKIQEKINHILLKKCKSYLDWILLVSIYNNEKFSEISDVNILNKQDVISSEIEEIEENVNVLEQLDKYNYDEEKLKQLKENIEYEYNYKISTITPTKTSVTELKKDKNSNFDSITLKQPKFIESSEETQVTASRKGTLIHMCMQRLNPKEIYTKDKLEFLIDDMLNKNIITLKEKEAINKEKIMKFINSNIWKEIREAKEVHKERPFYIEVPANELIEENTTDNILVQGIIDLYYIDKNDNLILLDYKTDYVENGKEYELIEKYRKQLMLYKQALENALHKQVYKTYIYSLYLGKELELA